jgi:hypothetical protein
VIGVTQAGFYGTEVGEHFDVAIPICAQAIIAGKGSFLDQRSAWWLMIMARLKPRISSEQATARLNALAPDLRRLRSLELAAGGPGAVSQIHLRHRPGSHRSHWLRRPVREQYERPLEILMVVVGLVLLIACANVASLMLARSAARQKGLVLRLLLGASGSRLIRQVLTERMVLSGAGALLEPSSCAGAARCWFAWCREKRAACFSISRSTGASSSSSSALPFSPDSFLASCPPSAHGELR